MNIHARLDWQDIVDAVNKEKGGAVDKYRLDEAYNIVYEFNEDMDAYTPFCKLNTTSKNDFIRRTRS